MGADKFLDGVLVLDFSRVLAGPFCTMTLGDLGARVIKVEPLGGDEARGMGPFRDEQSLYFASVNRGKESVSLDLKDPRARAAAQTLAGRADVLVENYRPGTMQRLGLGYEHLAARNPALVYLSLSGFGQTGPYADRGAYDVIVQALSGLMSITGPEGGPPTRVGASLGDLVPALYGVIAVLAALLQRRSSGRGTWIDLGMLDSVFAVLENALARFQASGQNPSPLGNRHPSITPFSTFAAADGPIAIACGNNALFERLCQALDAGRVAEDPRFASNALRTRNQAELALAIESRLATGTTADWERRLLAAGIPAARVNQISDLLADEHLRERGMLTQLHLDGEADAITIPGTPLRARGFDRAVAERAPTLGEHTASVLSELADFDARALRELLDDAVAGDGGGNRN
ncbi:MAG: CoA transferase [Chloroflexota bacterium]|nr:CoA transferase [Chloroflexota bacterium]MDE2935717.1 CoA transferase [Chloroflexota bacterium]